jgi:uncharacterized protein (TIGR02996 family)
MGSRFGWRGLSVARRRPPGQNGAMPHPPDLVALLDALRERPEDGDRWLDLAAWLEDHGREDEAAAVRVYWPVFRDNVTVAGVPLGLTLRQVARQAGTLGPEARRIEENLLRFLAED